jgi:uncharacterized membrane protein YoaK (UPF0700 family)
MPSRRRDALVAVLALTAGATDAVTFLGLGGVFSSVMTANMVLLGLSVGHQNGPRALHAAVALAGYILGALAASRFTGPPSEPPPGQPAPGQPAPSQPAPGQPAPSNASPGQPAPSQPASGQAPAAWPGRVTLALAVECVVLAAITVGWEIQGVRPSGAVQVVLLAGAALAMGIQGAAVRTLGVAGISTTYMTGMLTGILADLATVRSPAVRHRLVLLAMLILGAVASGITFTAAPRLAPLIPLVPLVCVLILAVGVRTRPPAAADHGEPDQPARLDPPDQPARLDPPDQPARLDPPDQPARPDRPDQPDRLDPPDQAARPDRPDQPDRQKD